MTATSTNNPPALVVPPEVDAELGELVERSRRLGRWSRSLTMPALLAGAGSAALWGLAWWLAPGGSLPVHLPADLVATAGGGSAGQFSDVASSLVGVMQGLGGILAVISIIFAGYRVVFDGRDIAEVMPMFMGAVVIGGASTMAGAILSPDKGAQPGASGPTLAELRDHVKGGLYTHVASQMEFYGGSEASKAYVLAQAALQELRDGTADAQGRQRAVAHVGTVLEHLKQPTDERFDGKTLYVLETELLGKATSQPAATYYATTERAASKVSGLAKVFGFLAAASGIAALGFGGAAYPLRKRVRRIHILLDRLPGFRDGARSKLRAAAQLQE